MCVLLNALLNISHTFIYLYVCVYVKDTHIKCRQKHSNVKVMHKDSNSKRASLIFQKQKRKPNKRKTIPNREEERRERRGSPSRNAQSTHNKRKPASKHNSSNNKNRNCSWPHLTWTQQVNIVIALVLLYYKADIFVARSATNVHRSIHMYKGGEQQQQIRRPEDARST